MAREAQLVALLLNPLLNHEPSPPSTPSPHATRERRGCFRRKGARALETHMDMPISPYSERDKVTAVILYGVVYPERGGARRPRPPQLSPTLSLNPVIATTKRFSEPYRVTSLIRKCTP